MKKLVAAVLTGVLVAGTLSTGVYAKDDDKTITVAASATPHAEILEEAKPILEKEGYDLEVTVFDDYVRPNEVVESGEFDANYFQHIPYLDQFNEEKGTHLVNAGGIHYEPFGIYPGTKDSLDDLEDGDSIAVPNDTTNEARALLLLQDNGIITLKDGAGLNATVKDIEENPHNVEIVELEAAQVARVTGETAYVVLNGNYALEAGFSVGKDALAYEKSDSEAAKTYVNVIAVKEGNEDSEKIQALVDVLKSDEIKDFINEKYDGAVIPFEESSDAEEADTEDVDDADSKDAENADTADTAEENADTADTTRNKSFNEEYYITLRYYCQCFYLTRQLVNKRVTNSCSYITATLTATSNYIRNTSFHNDFFRFHNIDKTNGNTNNKLRLNPALFYKFI